MASAINIMGELQDRENKSDSSDQIWIPPVVTVVGHVDHGKTTLLDSIRRSHVADKESGGITQHIGAYQIEFQGKLITFIDTPGHEAFSAMRGRGSRIADVILLVIDAAEGLRPQTLEALALAQASPAILIVVLNKVDLPAANVDRVKHQLSQQGLLVEGFGGQTLCLEVSAKTGQNLNTLLEMIVLSSQLHPPASRPEADLEAYVIESQLDRQRGPVATLVIKNGTLRLGQEIRTASVGGKVKQLLDDGGRRQDLAPPGWAVSVLGFTKVPAVGEAVAVGQFVAAPSSVIKSESPLRPSFEKRDQPLRLMVKADVSGSLEAIQGSLNRLPAFGDKIGLVFAGVGDVTDSDVNFAKASSAIILAFRVKVPVSSQKMAESLAVEIRSYQIIYQLIEDVEAAVKGLNVWQKSEGTGQAVVLKIFSLSSGDCVLGCRITQGTLRLGDVVELHRGEVALGRDRIKSLRIGQDRVEKVAAEKECGLLLRGEVADPRAGDCLSVVSG